MALSPMMRQYHDAKSAAGDALLLFRMGDFYELFYDDAQAAAKLLGLTLTSRDKGENPIPMAGFPHHQLDQYLAKIIAAGRRAAICEQLEDPKQAKGLVKRDITRIVSRGTVTDDALLDPHESNFLAAVIPGESSGIAWVDLSTGRFFATSIPAAKLADELARIQPVECLVSADADRAECALPDSAVRTERPAWAFAFRSAIEALAKQFSTHALAGLGFDDNEGSADAPALRAAGAILDYLVETQKTSLAHIERLLPFRASSTLQIDSATRRSLEITHTLRDGRRAGSLLATLDRTQTSMGARCLADWFANPLTDVAKIDERLESVEELLGNVAASGRLRTSLGKTYDLARLLGRVTTGRASPRDLACIAQSLALLPAVKEELADARAQRLRNLDEAIDPCFPLADKLATALVDSPPLISREGGIIRRGYDDELDRLHDLMQGGKRWIAQYQAQQVERTGIPNIKVGYNKVFGYYLEITHAHADKVPDSYIRKQTIKSAERYITPELKEHEDEVVAAEERVNELEYEIFVSLRNEVAAEGGRIQRTAEALAELDVMAGLAELARSRNYVRPVMADVPVLELADARHPVLDILEPEGSFVPNSVSMDARSPTDQQAAGQILLVTGPNMAGKSTYIRQVALITLMAQVGSFVPARAATIGVADHIFARVGASDELSRGQSTFMVEMTETARILNTATPRSLVILDEIGRGTSTYDGLSLAWSVVEYLHDRIGCRTLFATHYHELTDLENELPGIRNFNVAVKEWEDEVVFLHQIVPGAADKSYGIHVARLAGVPRDVNERAKVILALLEREHADGQRSSAGGPDGMLQLTLFGGADHPLLDKIRRVDLNDTTPLAALELIQKWQSELEGEQT